MNLSKFKPNKAGTHLVQKIKRKCYMCDGKKECDCDPPSFPRSYDSPWFDSDMIRLISYISKHKKGCCECRGKGFCIFTSKSALYECIGGPNDKQKLALANDLVQKGTYFPYNHSSSFVYNYTGPRPIKVPKIVLIYKDLLPK